VVSTTDLVAFLSRIEIITKYNSNIQKAKSRLSVITMMAYEKWRHWAIFALNSCSKSYIWNNHGLFQIIKNKLFCMNIFWIIMVRYISGNSSKCFISMNSKLISFAGNLGTIYQKLQTKFGNAGDYFYLCGDTCGFACILFTPRKI